MFLKDSKFKVEPFPKSVLALICSTLTKSSIIHSGVQLNIQLTFICHIHPVAKFNKHNLLKVSSMIYFPYSFPCTGLVSMYLKKPYPVS